MDADIARAASAIASADVLIVIAGAGFSADSGLPVYDDIAKERAYEELGLSYADLCSPLLMRSDPNLFVGFWGSCYNRYHDTSPHLGYAAIKSWRDQLFPTASSEEEIRNAEVEEKKSLSPKSIRSAASSFFVFTSNVDAHFRRMFPREQVFECHGSIDRWQCARPSRCIKRGAWPCTAPAFRFAVSPTTMLAPAGVGDAASKGGFPDSNHPRCLGCGDLARPAVLFFDDEEFVPDAAAKRRWERFNDAVVDRFEAASGGGRGKELGLVVLEIGCGHNVRTCRIESETIVRRFKKRHRVSLVRVNPDDAGADDGSNKDVTISLETTGLRAVKGIHEALVRMGVALPSLEEIRRRRR